MDNRAMVVAAAALASTVPAAVAQPDAPQPPDAGTEPAPVTFWGHVFRHGSGDPMPANTQFPSGEANYGVGSGGVCVAPPGDASCREPGARTLILFSTAGFVDVRDRAEFEQKGDYALLHNERGQTKDVLLDMSQDVTASIFFSVDFHGWAVGGGDTFCVYPHPPDVPCLYPYWGWDPGTAPDIVVDVGLYSANVGEHGANASDAPPIDASLEDGSATLIAKGRWGPGQVINGLPGSPNVNQFDVVLGRPQASLIPREHDFFVVYTIYDETSGIQYETGRIRFWGGEFFAPRFTLPVLNPIEVERVIPQFAHGQLAILAVLNTPWGSYDIAPDGVTLEVTGPDGKPVAPEHIQRFGKFSVGHGGHYIPVNFTWVWNHNADRLDPGTYTVRVGALNYAKTAAAQCVATFTIRDTDDPARMGGGVHEGVCGAQTATSEQLERIRQGAGGGP